MLNETAFTLASWAYSRAHVTSGIHVTLNKDLNRFIYPVAFILSFALFYFLVNKLVYRLTSNDYIHNLAIQKYKQKKRQNKQKSKKPLVIESTSDTMVLIEDNKQVENDNDDVDDDEDNETVQIDMLSIPEVQYHLWFYRFSWMECISCMFIWPLLFHILINFGSMHNDCYTFVKWDNYLIECMMVGHYIVDIEEVFSHGYVRRSRDLLLHHLIALIVFSYHLMDAMNFPWITLILFFEFNSFFNRSNLVLKFHDPEQIGILWNLSNIGNFATMLGVRCVVLLRLFVYDIPVS